jgi:GNAT superfamily N-acetyltransferase
LRVQGAGRLLIETLADMAKTNGWFRLYWMTHKDNATARIFYDKLAAATDWVRYDAVIEW